ncbi:MAG: dipeptidase [Deltaproteobacteria bacterium]|nr:dipeptidase [Deltaproteobacteria bacterium]
MGIAAAMVLAVGAVAWVGTHLESFINRVEPVAVPGVSPAARALHDSSFVADMHADTLLMRADVTAPSRSGHVDLPRLQDGGVALQFFTIVTRFPLGAGLDNSPSDGLDLLTLAGCAQRTAFCTSGPLARTLLQTARLRDSIARSDGLLLPVRTQAELDTLLARRAADRRVVGALLGIEGAHALEDDLANLDVVYDAGVRMIGPTHFFDNAFAGSAHGTAKGGLTPLGRQLITRMEEKGMLVDLAHLSPRGIDDVLAMATHPLVVSHTGVRATCDNQRNLSDAHIQAIARTGGVIGIGYWDTAVCGTEMRYVTAAMRHVVTLVGDDFVGLGSDYDGATTVGFDTSQLPALTQQMMNDGFSDATIRKILGGNVLRVLRAVLPQE